MKGAKAVILGRASGSVHEKGAAGIAFNGKFGCCRTLSAMEGRSTAPGTFGDGADSRVGSTTLGLTAGCT